MKKVKSDKKTYRFTYTCEAQFVGLLSLTDQQLEKIKKLIGNNSRLVAGNRKDSSLIKLLIEISEFDFVPHDCDVEDIKVEREKEH